MIIGHKFKIVSLLMVIKIASLDAGYTKGHSFKEEIFGGQQAQDHE